MKSADRPAFVSTQSERKKPKPRLPRVTLSTENLARYQGDVLTAAEFLGPDVLPWGFRDILSDSAPEVIVDAERPLYSFDPAQLFPIADWSAQERTGLAYPKFLDDFLDPAQQFPEANQGAQEQPRPPSPESVYRGLYLLTERPEESYLSD